MKRFVNAHSLLDDLDAALLPSGKAFTDEQRTPCASRCKRNRKPSRRTSIAPSIGSTG